MAPELISRLPYGPEVTFTLGFCVISVNIPLSIIILKELLHVLKISCSGGHLVAGNHGHRDGGRGAAVL